jgi:hypothetical protein
LEKSSESSATLSTAEVTPAVESGGFSSDDSWKEEYESQVQAWRAQSAEAREKAEQERLRWEVKRTIEKEEAIKRKAAGIVEEQVEPWDKPAESSTSSVAAGLSSESEQPDVSQPSIPRTVSQQETLTDESQKWEEVPSVTSSFPSMTFPEHIDTPPRAPKQPKSSIEPPPSATLAIFDSSLSARTRTAAFFSSLAVNLLLPFVNGVMLGFGEIFAKNVVMGWLGWTSTPGSIAANLGLRTSRKEENRNPFSR